MNKQDIEIYDIDVLAFASAMDDKRSILRIRWDANIGFGQYDIAFTNDSDDEELFTTTKIEGDSECMDSNEKKEFIKMLFDKVIDKIEIVG